jgi:hypothetical protein
MTASTTPSLQWVVDRLAIEDTIVKSITYTDLRRFDEAASQFTPEAVFDYSSLHGPDFAAVPAAGFWEGVDDWVPGFDATQHQITNFIVDITGDLATCTCMVRAQNRLDQQFWTTAGVYYYRLACRDGAWKVTYLKYDEQYQEGESLVEAARARVSAARAAAGRPA